MDYLTSTIHEYQPILVGAGCLALGYMYGRHCRAVMENQADAPTTSDAACCAQITESFNYAAVDSKTMAVKRPSDSDLDCSERELTEKTEKCAKRDLAQLDVFDPHFFHKMPRKKEDMIWAQTAFKKQKSTPLMRREVVRTKAEPDQDSDDETLAQRLEYFTKSASGTRASVNRKPRESELLKSSSKRIQPTETTSCAQDVTTKLVSKGAARSLSGLGALATPLDDDDDGESSLEDTCRSPKTLCGLPDSCTAGDERELAYSAPQPEAGTLPCRSPLEEAGRGNEIPGDWVDDQPVLVLPSEPGMDSPDHAKMEVDSHTADVPEAAMIMRQGFTRVELPTSPPPELLHVQDRCEGEDDEQVPLHKLIKAEIHSLIHATDCGKRRKPRWCLGKTTKPISLRWFGKLSALASSWRKRKLCRRRRKDKQVAAPGADQPETLSSCVAVMQHSDSTTATSKAATD